MPSSLVADAAALADALLPSADAAAAFLTHHPLPSIFDAMSCGPGTPPADVDVVARALTIALATPAGAAALVGATPFAVAAAGSPAPALRSLAATQLGRLLAAGEGDAGHVAVALAGLLADGDAGVASAAETAAINAAGASASVPSTLLSPGVLDAVLASTDARVRLRGLAVAAAAVTRVAGGGGASAAAAAAERVLRPLAGELAAASTDPLAAAAALATVADTVAVTSAGDVSGGRVAALLARGVGRALASLLAPPTDTALRAQALQTAASLAAAAEACPDKDDATPALTAAVVDGVDRALTGDGTFDANADAEEEAAILAIGALASTPAGADAVAVRAPSVLAAVATAALDGRARAGARVAALHAVAAVVGAERATSRGDRTAAWLSPDGEASLARAVHAGAAASVAGRSPSAALDAVAASPDADARVAAYRCLIGLALRDWGAADVALHAPLLARVADTRATAATAAAEWRHAAALAVSATATDVGAGRGGSELGDVQRAALAAAVPRLEAAVRSGPHGLGGQCGAERGDARGGWMKRQEEKRKRKKCITTQSESLSVCRDAQRRRVSRPLRPLQHACTHAGARR